MLQIEHLTKTYGEKKAVDDLSLHILPGEIYGFIGHNGAGKTTPERSASAAPPSARTRWPASESLPTSRTIPISMTI